MRNKLKQTDLKCCVLISLCLRNLSRFRRVFAIALAEISADFGRVSPRGKVEKTRYGHEMAVAFANIYMAAIEILPKQ